MKMSPLLFLTFAAILVSVHGVCDQGKIDRIKKIWNGRPPTNILQRLKGKKITWLTGYPTLGADNYKIVCFTSTIDNKNEFLEMVFYPFKFTPVTTVYSTIVEENGVLTVQGETCEQEKKIYFLYLDDDLMSVYQCQDAEKEYSTFDGFGAIAATNSPWGRGSYQYRRKLRGIYSNLYYIGSLPLPPISTYCL